MNHAARRILTPVAATLLLAVAAPAPVVNPASAIAVAAGHPAERHLQAQRQRMRDGAFERLTLDVSGGKRLERDCRDDLCIGTWFDGMQRFTFGINAVALPDGGGDDRMQRTFAAIASTAFAEPAFLSGGGRVMALPDRDGRERFGVTAPGGTELIVSADRRTHHLQAVQNVDGSLIEPLVATGSAPPYIYSQRAYDAVSTVPEPLAPPAGADVRVGAAIRETTLLPGPLPRVPCRIAGRDATCLIDSGTTPTSMTLAFAERIGREPRGTIEIGGLGSYVTGVVDAGPLEVGAVEVSALHFAVVPHLRGAEFDAILGSDVLAKLRLVFDAVQHRVRISASRSELETKVMPLDFRDGLPYTDARLGDRERTESMLVDTGDTGTISIGYDEYLSDMSLFAPGGHSRAAGLGSPGLDALDGELSQITVGQIHFERVTIAAVRGQHYGHLGYGFVERCRRFVLDLGQRSIACSPVGNDASDSPTGER